MIMQLGLHLKPILLQLNGKVNSPPSTTKGRIMNNIKQKIMTINAKSLFYFFSKQTGEETQPFCFDTTKQSFYRRVVKQENEMDECPLLYQFLQELDKEKNKEDKKETTQNANEIPLNKFLFDKLVVVDFGDIFLPQSKRATENNVDKKLLQLHDAQDLIENGLKICFKDHEVHMVPFDKSGNMSRNSRITFINERYLEAMNERLNLGMDFANLSVVLSKYYAYRGLYLSSSQRIEHEKFVITPETLVIIKDARLYEVTRGPNKGQMRTITGENYERNIIIETATEIEKDTGMWRFEEPEEHDLEYNSIPYDGEGFITPTYSEYINETLGIQGASSYQVRLPFAKGMLHKVDVHAFLNEFSTGGIGEGEYWLKEDAFGIKRDLKKAQIILTESMFKGGKWLEEYCGNNDIEDPMQFYCEALKKYNHSFYISGTNLPYGHTKYTHLSYQQINTLDFTEDQFARVVNEHCALIKEPMKFWEGYNEKVSDELESTEHNVLDVQDKNNYDAEDNSLIFQIPNWKRAVFTNESFKNDIYIKQQLAYTQRSLVTKIAMGKLAVKGQTRYLCRDLLPLLASLLKSKGDIGKLWTKYIWQRFYMPMCTGEEGKPLLSLDYNKFYAFFRSPHLSRNEQCVLQPFVKTEKANYYQVGKVNFDSYNEHLNLYHKYFGHLTGVVMVPRGSVVPLCLGGADFDGDLVSVICNEDVVAAVRTGVYEENSWLKRKLTVIKIPSTDSVKESVPAMVPYWHIYNTFSNRIGQISNAAITIGQAEYDRHHRVKYEYDVNTPSCSKCTLLTGLEIDAAKNGRHPNLDLVINDEIKKCEYLKFLDDFKKLKKESEFSYTKMKVEKAIKKQDVKNGDDQATGVKQEVILVNAQNCKTEAEFLLVETGTYINELPILFMEQQHTLKKANKESKDEQVSHSFVYGKIDEKRKREQIEHFKESCEHIINLHFFYDKLFLKKVRKEKNKKSHGFENLEMYVNKIYDEVQAQDILETVIPKLRRKLEAVIVNVSAGIEIEKRINQYRWQFQHPNKRSEVLQMIIGNSFNISSFTNEEKLLLTHFGQHGYKILWFLIETVIDDIGFTFDELKTPKLTKEKEKYIAGDVQNLDCKLESAIKDYYEKNVTGIDLKIYRYCLDEIKLIIELYKDSLEYSTLICALYEVTEKSATARRFFWDVFAWKELKKYIVRKEEE